ncbi:hypothetical protein GV828_02670 [Flavobacterium sp. NST-5]|uniref:PKD/Chitinase domain-containing protein n=1 Tax=Flavobacterium ichthyis TaxID=2698827 RepID=A0ABW9Z7L4_9FLAO|nr:PKD domain-containing protein [Flavobacterium ichthyis]NBL64100.1 hypothetical protein [Flavobacterium ichthyis]
MKNFKYIIGLFLLFAIGCSDDNNDLGFVENAESPKNISALFTITQDNSGLVTIRPNGEGATQYKVDFGDGTPQSEIFLPGQTVNHSYAEGNYTVSITATGINGKETVYTQPLTVSFLAPTDLDLVVNPENGNPFQLNFSATANLETYFEIYFGEDPDQEPVQFNEGQTVSHTYANIGTYQVRLIAYSGGSATTEIIEEITIFNPLILPLNFESTTLNYAFGDFGGTFSEVVNNPAPSEFNASSRVGRHVKNNGAETWGGTTIALDEPVDFSTMTKISMKVWSPVAGAVVKLKFENLNDANIAMEVDQTTTVANGWETLVYDFGTVNNDNAYQRIALFFDFGNNGNGANYYFDDIKLTSGEAVLELPVTFENNSINYNFTNFGGAGAGPVANPNPSGINNSANVAVFNKPNGAETWAGTFLTFPDALDFSVLQKIKMKVWSPQSGITVMMKLENADASQFVEVPVVNSVANGWEELTFDFTGINTANQYVKIVLFFDFNVAGNGASYYFDDIKLSN